MGGIYEVYRWDRLRCHNIHTKFHKYWFSHSKVDGGHTDKHGVYYYYFSFFKIRKVGWIIPTIRNKARAQLLVSVHNTVPIQPLILLSC
jgi:hypothetical protein